jgi:peptide/nickel transport system ATP-binding protein
MLTLNNLKTHFQVPGSPPARAVDGVSLSIEPGEVVCLVGESGCGKSVTAFSILQLLPRNAVHPEGEILFHGEDILRMNVDQRRAIRGNRISMIFQEPGTSLNPVYTVGRQVAEALQRHRGMSRGQAQDAVVDMFREVGIPSPEERFKVYPHELSGGMKQRVMIAMALACGPELLIADEPTTALDVTIQAQILKLVQRLQADHGMAVLLITHNLKVVNQVADRVVVMYAGRIVEQADRHTLFTSPQHPYTRNLLKAIPDAGARGQPLAEIPGRVPPATAFPDHCRFADRCSRCFAACRLGEPPLVSVGEGQEAACYLFSKQGDGA